MCAEWRYNSASERTSDFDHLRCVAQGAAVNKHDGSERVTVRFGQVGCLTTPNVFDNSDLRWVGSRLQRQVGDG
jgi:hypothetical protein